MLSPLLIVTLMLVLGAEFVNGWTDAPNAIATVVSTRVLSPGKAVLMAAVLNLVGAIATGTAVATTIGKGIVQPDIITLPVVAAAMLTILVWSGITWFYAIPSSKSHELIAGLTGAAFAASGLNALEWSGWQKVLIGLGFSTIIGFIFGFIIMTILYWLLRKTSLGAIRSSFSRLQILSSAFMAFSHGSNDGQKFMGVFALTLLLGGKLSHFTVPIWVMVICGTIMGIGTVIGGWRIMRTLGFRLTRLEPVNGFAAETSGSLAILIASHFGIPLSTTHCITTSIMGVGASRRSSAVRWGMARNIVLTWIITFPACMLMGYLFSLGLKALGI
ncbi:MAG TPA: inorganic phosphate transporter [Dehalococcoidales bacterium]|nr:inorganic phosphate transporter [Dehalococcoidales bacterium]